MRKILWFGLLGAVGCLVGAAAGEALWHLPASGPDGQSIGRTLFSNELSDRLEKAGAKTGDVQVSLAWNNTNDLDLHCVDPAGEEVFFNHRRSASGGEMDIDMNYREPYQEHPVENIYWGAGKAPLGRYQVFVDYFANHGAARPTQFLCGWIVRGKKTEMRGSIAPDDGKKKIGEFQVLPLGQAAAATVTWQGRWTAAAWTALLALGFSLALVMGQNRYLGKPMVTPRQAAVVVVGALAAGAVAGGVANTLYEALLHQPWLASCGRLIGWVLLGGMLGCGMSFFVPNLPRVRAALAGIVGGLAGAAAFGFLGWLLGDLPAPWNTLPARWAGAALLGFCLGLMVAVVELVCREAWIEVFYGPKECKTFSLGRRPITIGSGPECIVYVGQSPALALSYALEDGRVRCARGGMADAVTVQPGYEETIGSVRVVVQGHLRTATAVGDVADAAMGPGASYGPLWLQLSRSTRIPLAVGVFLGPKELPGVLPRKPEGPVAEVVVNPKDPSVFGLKNLSKSIWAITTPESVTRRIEPGQSVQLRPGMKINFGELRVEITA
jgi:hypothetical protein